LRWSAAPGDSHWPLGEIAPWGSGSPTASAMAGQASAATGIHGWA